MPPRGPPDTYATLAYAFTSFLTVAIHTIFYERKVYPKESFLLAKAYNYPVRQSRHPLVCEWVNEAVAAVETELLKGTVARVSFVIFESENKGRPLERFVWDISDWPVVERQDHTAPFKRAGNSDDEPASSDGEDSAAEEQLKTIEAQRRNTKQDVDMAEQFRGVLSRLTNCSNYMKEIPEGCECTLSIEIKDESDPPVTHPQPWVPSVPSLQKTLVTRSNEAYGGDVKTATKKGADVGGVKTLPIRSVAAGEMVFEMWIEETRAKEVDAKPTSQQSDASSFPVTNPSSES